MSDVKVLELLGGPPLIGPVMDPEPLNPLPETLEVKDDVPGGDRPLPAYAGQDNKSQQRNEYSASIHQTPSEREAPRRGR